MDARQIEFGYNPPTGNRLIERVEGATFVRDLGHVLDVASQHFSSLWVSDHFMTGDRFRMECWTELAWIAARYPGPMLGTIVMANSYRHPPLLAKMAASLQVFSHGRFILGYGAGWADDEYHAYGYEFPSTKVRIEQMVEGIEAIRALWTESPANYEGRWYQLRDAYCEPRPDPQPTHHDRWRRREVPAPRRRASTPTGGTSSPQVDPDTAAQDGCAAGALRRRRARLRLDPQDVHVHCVPDADSTSKARDWAGSRARQRVSAVRRRHRPSCSTTSEPSRIVGFDLFQLVFAGFPETDDIELFVDKVLPAFR